jgi:hypothetical protein
MSLRSGGVSGGDFMALKSGMLSMISRWRKSSVGSMESRVMSSVPDDMVDSSASGSVDLALSSVEVSQSHSFLAWALEAMWRRFVDPTWASRRRWPDGGVRLVPLIFKAYGSDDDLRLARCANRSCICLRFFASLTLLQSSSCGFVRRTIFANRF